MKQLLLIILTSCLVMSSVRADEAYLNYRIPNDADKYGPMTTRESEVTYTKYYTKGANPINGKALVCVEHHHNKVLRKRELYKEGELHGVQRRWHGNGKIEAESPYKMGVMHGVFQHWSSQSQLLGKYEMNEGTGSRFIFYPNGSIKLLEEFKKGEGFGWFIEFYQNGQIEVTNKKKANQYIAKYNTAFYENGLVYFVGLTDGLEAFSGVVVYYSQNDVIREFRYFLEGKIVIRDQYLKASQNNDKIPSLLENPQDYKKHLNAEIVRLVDEYSNLEKVKIPLEFNEDGSIVTVSGKPFVLPK
jgi:antitoxin component YwqK of YwqJK toxin-antitoxin module